MNILVIGYGNPLRGDDGVGWRVAAAVAAALPGGAAEVLTVHQLTPELAEPISRAERVIFIDAAAEGEAGAVSCFALEDAGRQPALQGSHLTTPDALLGMAAELFGRCPPAHMVTVVGESFELSESLSPVVEAAAIEAIARVLELVTSR
jgi:hydrogenase maturation protease